MAKRIPDPVGVSSLRIGGPFTPKQIEQICDNIEFSIEHCRSAARNRQPVERIWENKASDFAFKTWSLVCAHIESFKNPDQWASWDFMALNGHPQAGSILVLRWNKYTLDFMSTPYSPPSDPRLEVIKVARHVLTTTVAPHWPLVLKRK